MFHAAVSIAERLAGVLAVDPLGAVADGQAEAFGAAMLALVASIVVIVAHHLGYPDFRSSRVKMGQAILGCGVLSLAYLLTASVIAPILAHAALHVAFIRFGMELPPHEEAKLAPLGSPFSEAA